MVDGFGLKSSIEGPSAGYFVGPLESKAQEGRYAESTALRAEVAAAMSKAAALRAESAAVEAESAAIRDGITAVEAEPAAIRDGITAVEAEPAAIRDGITAVEAEPAAIRDGITAVEAEPAAIRDGITAVQGEVAAAAKIFLDSIRVDLSLARSVFRRFAAEDLYRELCETYSVHRFGIHNFETLLQVFLSLASIWMDDTYDTYATPDLHGNDSFRPYRHLFKRLLDVRESYHDDSQLVAGMLDVCEKSGLQGLECIVSYCEEDDYEPACLKQLMVLVNKDVCLGELYLLLLGLNPETDDEERRFEIIGSEVSDVYDDFGFAACEFLLKAQVLYEGSYQRYEDLKLLIGEVFVAGGDPACELFMRIFNGGGEGFSYPASVSISERPFFGYDLDILRMFARLAIKGDEELFVSLANRQNFYEHDRSQFIVIYELAYAHGDDSYLDASMANLDLEHDDDGVYEKCLKLVEEKGPGAACLFSTALVLWHRKSSAVEIYDRIVEIQEGLDDGTCYLLAELQLFSYENEGDDFARDLNMLVEGGSIQNYAHLKREFTLLIGFLDDYGPFDIESSSKLLQVFKRHGEAALECLYELCEYGFYEHVPHLLDKLLELSLLEFSSLFFEDDEADEDAKAAEDAKPIADQHGFVH